MPHQCTDCGTVFADGSTEMLSGCPDCGGDTFQYLPDELPDSSSTSSPDTDSDATSPIEPPERSAPGDAVASTVGSAAATVRKFVGGDSTVGTSPEAADPLSPWEGSRDRDRPEPTRSSDRSDPVGGQLDSTKGPEDDAQASARSAVVSPEELPDSGAADLAVGSPSVVSSTEAATDSGSDSERPDLEELREELNDQFESIRIVEPGQYELNLMELYEREEYIIALQEDGRYRIQVPEAWRD